MQQLSEGGDFSLGNKKPEIQLFGFVVEKWDPKCEWFHPRSYVGIGWIIWGPTLSNPIWLKSYGHKPISLDNVLPHEQLFAWDEECRSDVWGKGAENIAKTVLPISEIEIENILEQNQGILQPITGIEPISIWILCCMWLPLGLLDNLVGIDVWIHSIGISTVWDLGWIGESRLKSTIF